MSDDQFENGSVSLTHPSGGGSTATRSHGRPRLGHGRRSRAPQPGTKEHEVGATTHRRLTLTVEEAGETLGISSRAFAYESVRRSDIPSIRIRTCILVPKVILERLLDGAWPTP